MLLLLLLLWINDKSTSNAKCLAFLVDCMAWDISRQCTIFSVHSKCRINFKTLERILLFPLVRCSLAQLSDKPKHMDWGDYRKQQMLAWHVSCTSHIPNDIYMYRMWCTATACVYISVSVMSGAVWSIAISQAPKPNWHIGIAHMKLSLIQPESKRWKIQTHSGDAIISR